MKPERDDEFCDMDVIVREPRVVLEEIGLLIVEARTPDPSVKGRREGSHCTSLHGTSHLCQHGKKECSIAGRVKNHMYCSWQNLVPTYIDVLLLPNCKHGQQATTIVEGSSEISKEEYILLERWYIGYSKKRHDRNEGSVSNSFLVQALRSYLHFSQLSSWLLSSSGSLQLSVVYRFSAPGEGILHNFDKNPDKHNFPKTELTDFVLCISVESLPRRNGIPTLFCQQTTQTESCPLGKKGRSSPKYLSDAKNKDAIIDKESPPKKNYLDKVYNNYEPSNKPKRHSKLEQRKDSKNTELGCGCASTSKPDSQRRSPSMSPPGAKSISTTRNLDVASTSRLDSLDCDRNRHRSPSRQIFKDNLLPLQSEYDEHNLQVTDPTSKRLHSPKILLASASNNTKVEYKKKKHLDLDCPDDCLNWEKDYLSAKINPVDINEYLTNLQNYSFSSQSDNSSDDNTPRCKFYIGENCDHKPCNHNLDDLETPLKRQRERNCSFEEVPRKLFAPSLSGSSEIQPAVRTDQSETLQKKDDKQFKNGFHDSVNSENSKNGHQNGTEASNGFSKEVENGIKNVTDMLDKFSVNDEKDNDVLKDSGLHFDEKPCDNKLCNTSHIDLHDSCLDKSQSLNETELMSRKYDSNNVCQNSPKRAFSVPDYSSDNEVAVANGFSLCNTVDTKSPLSKVLNSPTMEDIMSFQRHLTKSASMMFNQRTGLPSQSSPAPTKRKSGRFDYDSTLSNTKAIKYALSCSKLALASEGEGEQILEESGRVLSTSAPASTNCLLGNFEESILNGRIEPCGAVDGFTAEIGASGSFCPKHLTLPVSAYFFKLSDDNAPSPYLGHIDLGTLGKRGYHIPKKGTVQVTLFNPNKTVVKMFVVMYDMTDMPPRCQTFIRQRTLYMPVDSNSDQPSYLRYLIHLRFASTKSSKVYLHTDLRLIFARDKFEFDNKVAQYELRSFTEGPTKPKYSPKR